MATANTEPVPKIAPAITPLPKLPTTPSGEIRYSLRKLSAEGDTSPDPADRDRVNGTSDNENRIDTKPYSTKLLGGDRLSRNCPPPSAEYCNTM